MNSLNFIQKLNNLTIDEVKLRQLGYSDVLVKEIQSEFKKDLSGNFVEYNDEILNLVINFNLGHLPSSFISFYQNIKEIGDFVEFGEGDGYYLGKHIDQKIYQLDKDSYEVMSICADSFPKFLDALIIFFEAVRKRTLKEIDAFDEKLNLEIAKNCAEVAGNIRYYKFYKYIL